MKSEDTADRLVEQSAGIVAQVKDQALELAARLLLEVLHRLLDAGVSLLGELRQPNIADIVRLQPRLHHLDLDHLADQRHLERLVDVLALDGQHDLEFGGPRIRSTASFNDSR